jgi:hypothetical protein
LKISDCYLTPEILDQLIAGKYPINGFPSYDISASEIEASDDEIPSELPPPKANVIKLVIVLLFL